ncbi:hypothetical protein K505DRAFT_323933 [Melanomma pulvis-pyrius CBS 109.77]|uniref:non-specific serine/threonine protein kinase n=1 Tax=Melanomma pulvis-pyrius CBS 109.77 TaxID=1314802 RepID=A0A6A6XGM0_9PLEO|nr:hypothetical protein K505DRAFT_323933 [Melanomma pulvis-pyrius CBS 109.77]
MPRRRPPGAGPGLSTTLLAILLVLPFISSAAQQQQPENVRRRSLREDARVGAITPPKNAKPPQASVEDTPKRPYTPLIVQNVRAVATTVPPAPANPAVRAPPARNAASSGGLSRPSARSLQDWEVEDFVLLATVDGHIHARDRYNGEEIWELDIKKPMLETIYNTQNDSEGDNDIKNMPFLWIVEPKEDGALYILTPGPYPVLQSLGMTVKQLAEDMSPYSSDDPPVVYTAQKRNTMLVVDAQTGVITKSFSSSGATFMDGESCVPQPTEFVQSKARECKGYFNLGQTEYIISIQNKNTGANICTIKYSEWTPNNRDRDLQAQYLETTDQQYIYTRYDGHAIAYDHKRPKRSQRHLSFKRKFSSPVVRVFDVARPFDDEDTEPALVLLPQPPGPAIIEDKAKNVWLNTTESGSWYALSEANYPAVTDSAPQALCYTQSDLLSWEGPYYLPGRSGLVGVHVLDYQVDPPLSGSVRGIAPPTYDDSEVIVPIPPEVPQLPKQPPKEPLQTVIESRTQTNWWPLIVTLAVLLTGSLSYQLGQPTKLDLLKNNLLSRFTKSEKVDKVTLPKEATPVLSELEAQMAQEELAKSPVSDVSALESPIEEVHSQESVDVEPNQRRVTFAIPDDEETDIESLSRTTTAEQPSPLSDDGEVTRLETPRAEASETVANGIEGSSEAQATTPTKKKKAHRGKRGGQKLKARKPRDEDEVDRIVDAVKHLDETPTLHPDERTMDNQDIQDVSNIKRIGKLTIDCDRLLGNGSGGTFVFEGKWNDREVAVKRMLPQYFGLAEQEVKLLQESDLHPNVIRYFDDEKDENFLYIAVELCQASLFDLYHDGRPSEELTKTQQRLVNEINFDIPSALRQLAKGVHHLHGLRIIHRDIKPQNILIAYPQRNQSKGPRLVISDFGLCKTLPDNVSTLIGTTGNAGTTGWKAPELILQPKEIMDRGSSTGHSRDSSSSTDPVSQGVKRAVDIFSLGCVFFYVLTNGSHPFDDDEGWMQIRELNIKKDKANFAQLSVGDDSVEPIHLISWMLSNRPEDRPTALQVINHPFFWSAEKRLNFLCDCSDHWERESRDPPSDHLSVLERYSWDVLDKKRDFLAKLDRGFINSLGKQRKYTGDRMLDLLRALRNKKNHYEDMDEGVKAKVGALPDGYLRYWTIKFPRLVMSCYECVIECGLQEESRFKTYFQGENVTGY